MTSQTLEPATERKTTWKFNRSNIADMFHSGIEVDDVIITDENNLYTTKKLVIGLNQEGEKTTIETIEKDRMGRIIRRSHEMYNGHYGTHLIDRYSPVDKEHKELNQRLRVVKL